jgi:CCR4-NOT transcription complex subunit 9
MNKDGTFRETNDEHTPTSQEDITLIIQWVNDIKDESKRETALAELSKKRENFADLALYLWYSTGTVASL